MPICNIDETYLRMAHVWAENSYAKRKKVGCIIVKDNQIIADGYNGTPYGFDNDCEHKIPGGYVTKDEVLHAESNAITKLARSNQSSVGSTLYSTLSPCWECSKLIIQAGIVRVVYTERYKDVDGITLLKRANIEVNHIYMKGYPYGTSK